MANSNQEHHMHRPKWDNRISTGHVWSFLMLLAVVIAAWIALQQQVRENTVVNDQQEARFIQTATHMTAEHDRLENLVYRESGMQTDRVNRMEDYLIRIEKKIDYISNNNPGETPPSDR